MPPTNKALATTYTASTWGLSDTQPAMIRPMMFVTPKAEMRSDASDLEMPTSVAYLGVMVRMVECAGRKRKGMNVSCITCVHSMVYNFVLTIM